ncbi:hypothetical protein QUF95_08895 [Paenibacillus silvae]|nr:hypothetical protein [Paenibacillus silvae]
MASRQFLYSDGDYQLLRRKEPPLEGVRVSILDYTKGGTAFEEALKEHHDYSNQTTGG